MKDDEFDNRGKMLFKKKFRKQLDDALLLNRSSPGSITTKEP